MGCGVLEFGEGEVGPHGRGFEDIEGMKVDLFFFFDVMLEEERERGVRGKDYKSFFFFLFFFF